MRFWKKRVDDNHLRICELERKVQQLECKHNFVVKKIVEKDLVDLLVSHRRYSQRIIYECSYCKQTKRRYWDRLTKKEQQALKTLNLVPEDWEVKVKEKP